MLIPQVGDEQLQQAIQAARAARAGKNPNQIGGAPVTGALPNLQGGIPSPTGNTVIPYLQDSSGAPSVRPPSAPFMYRDPYGQMRIINDPLEAARAEERERETAIRMGPYYQQLKQVYADGAEEPGVAAKAMLSLRAASKGSTRAILGMSDAGYIKRFAPYPVPERDQTGNLGFRERGFWEGITGSTMSDEDAQQYADAERIYYKDHLPGWVSGSSDAAGQIAGYAGIGKVGSMLVRAPGVATGITSRLLAGGVNPTASTAIANTVSGALALGAGMGAQRLILPSIQRATGTPLADIAAGSQSFQDQFNQTGDVPYVDLPGAVGSAAEGFGLGLAGPALRGIVGSAASRILPTGLSKNVIAPMVESGAMGAALAPEGQGGEAFRDWSLGTLPFLLMGHGAPSTIRYLRRDQVANMNPSGGREGGGAPGAGASPVVGTEPRQMLFPDADAIWSGRDVRLRLGTSFQEGKEAPRYDIAGHPARIVQDDGKSLWVQMTTGPLEGKVIQVPREQGAGAFLPKDFPMEREREALRSGKLAIPGESLTPTQMPEVIPGKTTPGTAGVAGEPAPGTPPGPIAVPPGGEITAGAPTPGAPTGSPQAGAPRPTPVSVAESPVTHHAYAPKGGVYVRRTSPTGDSIWFRRTTTKDGTVHERPVADSGISTMLSRVAKTGEPPVRNATQETTKQVEAERPSIAEAPVTHHAFLDGKIYVRRGSGSEMLWFRRQGGQEVVIDRPRVIEQLQQVRKEGDYVPPPPKEKKTAQQPAQAQQPPAPAPEAPSAPIEQPKPAQPPSPEEILANIKAEAERNPKTAAEPQPVTPEAKQVARGIPAQAVDAVARNVEQRVETKQTIEDLTGQTARAEADRLVNMAEGQPEQAPAGETPRGVEPNQAPEPAPEKIPEPPKATGPIDRAETVEARSFFDRKRPGFLVSPEGTVPTRNEASGPSPKFITELSKADRRGAVRVKTEAGELLVWPDLALKEIERRNPMLHREITMGADGTPTKSKRVIARNLERHLRSVKAEDIGPYLGYGDAKKANAKSILTGLERDGSEGISIADADTAAARKRLRDMGYPDEAIRERSREEVDQIIRDRVASQLKGEAEAKERERVERERVYMEEKEYEAAWKHSVEKTRLKKRSGKVDLSLQQNVANTKGKTAPKETREPVDATIYDEVGVAVHKNSGAGAPWSVTEVNSGFALGTFKSERAATQFVKALRVSGYDPASAKRAFDLVPQGSPAKDRARAVIDYMNSIGLDSANVRELFGGKIPQGAVRERVLSAARSEPPVQRNPREAGAIFPRGFRSKPMVPNQGATGTPSPAEGFEISKETMQSVLRAAGDYASRVISDPGAAYRDFRAGMDRQAERLAAKLSTFGSLGRAIATNSGLGPGDKAVRDMLLGQRAQENLFRTFVRNLARSYSQLTPEQSADLFWALEKRVDLPEGHRARDLAKHAMSSFDNILDNFIRHGLADPKLREKYQRPGEQGYAPRFYKSGEQTSMLRSELSASEQIRKTMLGGILDAMRQRNIKGPVDRAKSRVESVESSRLARRSATLEQAIENGLITNARSVLAGLAQEGRTLLSLKLYDSVIQLGPEYVQNEKTIGFKQLQSQSGKSYGLLEGKWVRNDLVEYIREHGDPKRSGWTDLLYSLQAMAKESAIMGRPSALFNGNIVGNTFNSRMLGMPIIEQPKWLLRAVDALLEHKSGKRVEAIEKLLDADLLPQETFWQIEAMMPGESDMPRFTEIAGDTRIQYADNFAQRFRERLSAELKRAEGFESGQSGAYTGAVVRSLYEAAYGIDLGRLATGKQLNISGEGIRKVWTVTDNLYKIANYIRLTETGNSGLVSALHQMATGKKPVPVIPDTAVEMIRDSWDPRAVAPWVKSLSRLPLVGPAFIRPSYMATRNAFLRGYAYRNPLGFMLWALPALAVRGAYQSFTGEDDEEIDAGARRASGGDPQLADDLAPIYKTQDGETIYWNVGRYSMENIVRGFAPVYNVKASPGDPGELAYERWARSFVAQNPLGTWVSKQMGYDPLVGQRRKQEWWERLLAFSPATGVADAMIREKAAQRRADLGKEDKLPPELRAARALGGSIYRSGAPNSALASQLEREAEISEASRELGRLGAPFATSYYLPPNPTPEQIEAYRKLTGRRGSSGLSMNFPGLNLNLR